MTDIQKKEFRARFENCYDSEFNVYNLNPEELFEFLDGTFPFPLGAVVSLPKPNPTVCKLQSLLIEADAIRTEIQGMETFNDERIRNGNSVGYSQEHFTDMAEQLREIAKQMKELANTCEA